MEMPTEYLPPSFHPTVKIIVSTLEGVTSGRHARLCTYARSASNQVRGRLFSQPLRGVVTTQSLIKKQKRVMTSSIKKYFALDQKNQQTHSSSI